MLKMRELEPAIGSEKIIQSRDKHLLTCRFDIVLKFRTDTALAAGYF